MFGIVSFIIKFIMLSIIGITIYLGATEPGGWDGFSAVNVFFAVWFTVLVFLFLHNIKKYIEEKKQRPDETDEEYQLRMKELKKRVYVSSESYRHSDSDKPFDYDFMMDMCNNPMYRNFPGNIYYRNDNNNSN